MIALSWVTYWVCAWTAGFGWVWVSAYLNSIFLPSTPLPLSVAILPTRPPP
jgi:hypothetical protein